MSGQSGQIEQRLDRSLTAGVKARIELLDIKQFLGLRTKFSAKQIRELLDLRDLTLADFRQSITDANSQSVN